MTVLLDSRSRKALEIAAGASRWTRLPSGAFSIPSQGNPGQLYIATPSSCQCPDAERNPERLCKHSIAVALIQVLTAESESKRILRNGLAPTREDDDVVSWARPARTQPAITDAQAARIFGKL